MACHHHHHNPHPHYTCHCHQPLPPPPQPTSDPLLTHLLHTLLLRVASLESKLPFSPSSFPSTYPSPSLRDAAARAIQTHFRRFLVRRSRALGDLRRVEWVRSRVFEGRVGVGGALEMLLLLDDVQSRDPMVLQAKRATTEELVRIIEIAKANGIKIKSLVEIARLRRRKGFAGNACRPQDEEELDLFSENSSRVSEDDLEERPARNSRTSGIKTSPLQEKLLRKYMGSTSNRSSRAHGEDVLGVFEDILCMASEDESDGKAARNSRVSDKKMGPLQEKLLRKYMGFTGSKSGRLHGEDVLGGYEDICSRASDDESEEKPSRNSRVSGTKMGPLQEKLLRKYMTFAGNRSGGTAHEEDILGLFKEISKVSEDESEEKPKRNCRISLSKMESLQEELLRKKLGLAGNRSDRLHDEGILGLFDEISSRVSEDELEEKPTRNHSQEKPPRREVDLEKLLLPSKNSSVSGTKMGALQEIEMLKRLLLDHSEEPVSGSPVSCSGNGVQETVLQEELEGNSFRVSEDEKSGDVSFNVCGSDSLHGEKGNPNLGLYAPLPVKMEPRGNGLS